MHSLVWYGPGFLARNTTKYNIHNLFNLSSKQVPFQSVVYCSSAHGHLLNSKLCESKNATELRSFMLYVIICYCNVCLYLQILAHYKVFIQPVKESTEMNAPCPDVYRPYCFWCTITQLWGLTYFTGISRRRFTYVPSSFL